MCYAYQTNLQRQSKVQRSTFSWASNDLCCLPVSDRYKAFRVYISRWFRSKSDPHQPQLPVQHGLLQEPLLLRWLEKVVFFIHLHVLIYLGHTAGHYSISWSVYRPDFTLHCPPICTSQGQRDCGGQRQQSVHWWILAWATLSLVWHYHSNHPLPTRWDKLCK